MRIAGSITWLVVLASLSAAVGQEVKYVACQSSDAIKAADISCSEGKQFAKASEGMGTVNPKAVVATFQGTTIKAAIDSAKADAEHPDLLRLDFTGSGKFDNESVVPLTITLNQLKTLNATVGPKTLQVKLGNRTVPVTISGA